MSRDRTDLAAQMKAFEHVYRTTLAPGQYSVIRVDGRAFHTLLRNAEKPFDPGFMNSMGNVAALLCKEITGAVFAYLQSDEISVLIADPNPQSQPWFGGVVQKQVSIAAATATMAFNDRHDERTYGYGTFDARVFTLPGIEEVMNYFIWRQHDCIRNSISMAAQAHFGAKRLRSKNMAQMREMLAEKGIVWDRYSDGIKLGRIMTRKSGERGSPFIDRRTGQETVVLAVRHWWEIEDAPYFTTAPGDWLAENIPGLP